MLNKKAQTELAVIFLLVIIFAFVFAIGLFLEVPLAIFAISYILLRKKFSKGPSIGFSIFLAVIATSLFLYFKGFPFFMNLAYGGTLGKGTFLITLTALFMLFAPISILFFKNKRKTILILSIILLLLVVFSSSINIKSTTEKGKITVDCQRSQIGTNLCYSEKAIEINDVTICDYIKYDEDYRLYCIGSFNKDFQTCSEISDINRKELCYLNIIKEGDYDISLCEEFKDPARSWRKEECTINFAVKLKDKTLCETIKDSTRMDRCLASVDYKISQD